MEQLSTSLSDGEGGVVVPDGGAGVGGPEGGIAPAGRPMLVGIHGVICCGRDENRTGCGEEEKRREEDRIGGDKDEERRKGRPFL
jgi:hypothetical protein